MPQEQESQQQHPDIRMPPPLIHLGALLIGYGLDQALHWSVPVWGGERILCSALALFAVLLLSSALWQFHSHGTTVMPHRAADELITSGVFHLTRNPIYLAFAILHLACAVTLGSPGMLIMLVPVVWVMQTHVIAAEETFHQQRFGPRWDRYRHRVRRWL